MGVGGARFPGSVKVWAVAALVVVVGVAALSAGIYYIAGTGEGPSPTAAPAQPPVSAPAQPTAVATIPPAGDFPAGQAPAAAEPAPPVSPAPATSNDPPPPATRPVPEATALHRPTVAPATEAPPGAPPQAAPTIHRPTPTPAAPTAPAPVLVGHAPSGGSAQAAMVASTDNPPPTGPAPQAGGSNSGDQVQSVPTKSPLQYPRLSAHLNRLVATTEAGQATAEQAAQGAPIHNEGSVAVTIHLSAHVDDVVAYLEDNGGDPRNVGVDYIEAYVPVPLLAPVSQQPGVTRVREIIPPQAAQGGPASSP